MLLYVFKTAQGLYRVSHEIDPAAGNVFVSLAEQFEIKRDFCNRSGTFIIIQIKSASRFYYLRQAFTTF